MKKGCFVIMIIFFILFILLVVLIAFPVLRIHIYFLHRNGAPHTLEEVKEMLDNSLTISYEHISTEVFENRRWRGSIENVYTFKDENGVEFNVTSLFMLWGVSDTGFSLQKESRCNYDNILFSLYSENIESILSEYLRDGDFTVRTIYVYNIDDLPTVADAVEAVLKAVPTFQIRGNIYRNTFSNSSVPTLRILFKYYYEWDGRETYAAFDLPAWDSPWIDYSMEYDDFNRDEFIRLSESRIREALEEAERIGREIIYK